MLFAQVLPPGSEQVVNTAAANAGGRWEVVAVAVVFMLMVSAMGGIMWKLWARQGRTDQFIQDRLVGLLTVTNGLLTRTAQQEASRLDIVVRLMHLCEEMLAVFTSRPCLADEERAQANIKDELEGLKAELKELRQRMIRDALEGAVGNLGPDGTPVPNGAGGAGIASGGPNAPE